MIDMIAQTQDQVTVSMPRQVYQRMAFVMGGDFSIPQITIVNDRDLTAEELLLKHEAMNTPKDQLYSI